MNIQDIELLYKALCGYLPYGVNVMVSGIFSKTIVKRLESVDYFSRIRLYGHNDFRIDITENSISGRVQIKPYLRPMSSMTKDERKEYWSITSTSNHCAAIDWLNSHYFDYRCLIEKGLALEAPADMYNI